MSVSTPSLVPLLGLGARGWSRKPGLRLAASLAAAVVTGSAAVPSPAGLLPPPLVLLQGETQKLGKWLLPSCCLPLFSPCFPTAGPHLSQPASQPGSVEPVACRSPTPVRGTGARRATSAERQHGTYKAAYLPGPDLPPFVA